VSGYDCGGLMENGSFCLYDCQNSVVNCIFWMEFYIYCI